MYALHLLTPNSIDLACRNCLLTDTFQVKISDFGMSKDVGDMEYYRMTHHGDMALPVRWMAPECLMDGKFDSKGMCSHFQIIVLMQSYPGDIWSFGIVMWEIFSMGQTPYAGIGNEEVLERIVMGQRLPHPSDTPDSVYNLMMECWGPARPSFTSLHAVLSFWSKGGNIDSFDVMDEVKDNPESVVQPDPMGRQNYVVLLTEKNATILNEARVARHSLSRRGSIMTPPKATLNHSRSSGDKQSPLNQILIEVPSLPAMTDTIMTTSLSQPTQPRSNDELHKTLLVTGMSAADEDLPVLDNPVESYPDHAQHFNSPELDLEKVDMLETDTGFAPSAGYSTDI